MVSQGLWGAVEQYWTVEDKPRLDRRNSWFEDHQINFNNARVFALGIVACFVGITIVMFWCLLGVLL